MIKDVIMRDGKTFCSPGGCLGLTIHHHWESS
jgi:hypothetical protein